MAVKWTEEQQKVIDTRGCNILVSAAAGSGKTAVLVARILDKIAGGSGNPPEGKRQSGGHEPIDIDRLLVVTFTNAAAAEMRERIRDALEKRAEEEPENEHLQRQLVLVHNAKITTIHSFCLQVLRSHFQTAGIDPAFRVADEGEVLLLEQDTAKEAVDAAYENADEEFHRFLEVFTTGKGDQMLEETILQICHFALGQPWPLDWLRECRESYRTDNIVKAEAAVKKDPQEDGAKDADAKTQGTDRTCENTTDGETELPVWLAYIQDDTARLLADMRAQTEEALRIAREPDGPYPYIPALEADLELLEKLEAAGKAGEGGYRRYACALAQMKPFARLGTKKDDTINLEKKLRVQAMRTEVKDALTGLRKRYYYADPEDLQREYEESGLIVRVLTRLAEDLLERLAQKKAAQNIVDFGDLEHLALRVLVEKTDGAPVPTAAAREYAESFEEIMIDEYQDSNLVQELILSSVSGRGRGENNLFLVGDVKQSIYRFRLARPELFMEKYRTYREAGADACRIDLHRNFRSRAQVLAGVNDVFRQIMTEHPGEIVYDEDAALYPGAEFAQGADESFLKPEFLLLEAESTARQREEAMLVGRRIREMVGRAVVWDKEEGQYRPVRYGDIVILLRTVSGWAETFGEVLTDMGIPCMTGSQKGYFSAAEIRTVLAYLQILDNPVQDIPLAAVLRSAIGGFDDEELAKLRVFSKKRSFYDCCQEYRAAGDDQRLKDKLERFFATFEHFRAKCAHTPVHLLLWEILDVTGYGAYAESLPAGRQRRANLDMLVEKAIAYEATSYRGLYHFVHYIESLKKYEVDYGEANADSGEENTVRIMSIHKSKGLEFPVVFVSGLGKQFNESDARSRVVMHPEFGIGCDYVDDKLRTRRATLLKCAIRQKTTAESLGEELRVLYVAMTRAKEKLILTGSVGDLEKKLERWQVAAMHRGEQLSYAWLSSASTYLDWVVPAVLRLPAPAGGEGKAGTEEGVCSLLSSKDASLVLRIADVGEEEEEQIREDSAAALQLWELLQLNTEICYDEATRDHLQKVFRSEYPFAADAEIPGKLSVSELKKLSRLPEEEDTSELYREETVIPLIPEFRKEKEPVTGAARGTIYHAFMENLDFLRIPEPGDCRGTCGERDAGDDLRVLSQELQIQLEEMISCGKMSGEEAEALSLSDIQAFLQSGVGARMRRAARCGQLFRERPFVLGVPASEIRSGFSSQETVLVQGIIDAWFVEGDEIVVLDYKTDRVDCTQALADKYRAQLDYYALALERLTGLRVKERIIYSFHLCKEHVL